MRDRITLRALLGIAVFVSDVFVGSAYGCVLVMAQSVMVQSAIAPTATQGDTKVGSQKNILRPTMTAQDSLSDILRRYEAENRSDTSTVRVLCALSNELVAINPVQALEYGKRGKALAEHLNDRTGLAGSLEGIGRAYRVQGLYGLSLEQFFSMLRIAEQLHDKRLQMLALRRIGWNYLSANNYEAALQYTERVLRMSKELADILEEGIALNTIGQVQMEQKQYDSALENFRVALVIAQKYATRDNKLLLDVTENIAQIYSRRGDFSTAESYFRTALAAEERLNRFAIIVFLNQMLGDVLVQEKKYAEALRYAQKALALSDSLHIGLFQEAIFRLFASIYAGLGNAPLALEYYKRSVALKDSLAGVATAQKAAVLESAFQQEKSDRVRLGLESENRLQATIRNSVIVVGVLLAVLLGVLLNRYRLKVHSEEQLRHTNDEIRRQQALLEEQARNIEEMNTELQESNVRLQDTNVELDTANAELYDYVEELNRINAELDARNETLSELNREKNEFLSIAAHDLKNPLAVIRLTSEMLERFGANMSEDEKTLRLKNISATVDRMMAIITNILNSNALETGVLSITSVAVSVSECIASLTDDYLEPAQAKSITLQTSLPEASLFVLADKTMLYGVLENLLSNALKFSPSGTTVTLSAYTQDTMCRMAVQDEGPGISHEDKAKLFGKFARLSARPTGGEHSTGLGLSIVKKMVEAMHGRVWCESELGKGATFIAELPVATFTTTREEEQTRGGRKSEKKR